MKTLSKKIKMIVALMAAIVFSGTTLTYAYAESFTVASVSNNYDYKDVTGSGGSSFQTNIFSVKDSSGTTYDALCVLPKKASPPVNATYSSGEWTYDCRRTKIYFYGLGSGASSGPLSSFTYNQRVILTHACLAYEGGDPDWNGGSWNLLGQAGATGYDAVMELYKYAGEHGLPDGYNAATIYLTADGTNSPYQNLVAYWEEYTEPRGWIELHKSSSNTAITNNNGNYSLEGAVYGIYSDSDLKNLVTTIKTDASGLAVSTWLSKGTYYIREWSAGKGYDVDITTHSVSITEANKATNVYVTEVPQKGAIQLHKYSSMPSISDNNNCYSLEGAVYGVYTDYACTQLYTRLTTDKNGNASVSDLPYKTYYIKEISASKGFELSSEVFTCNVNSTTAVKVDAPEIPGNDPISLVLSKRTADGHGSGNARLEGAEYTVKYYDTVLDTDPAQSGYSPKYTWVFKTDENGRISLRQDYLISGDNLIYQNGHCVLPLGTVTIQETKAPEGYLINDTIYVAQTILENNYVKTTNLPTEEKAAQETPYEGTISIQKFLGGSDAVKTSEPDAEFEIYLKSAGSYDAAPEESRQIITTDTNGYALTKRLPYGTYTIHQTKGNNKYYFINDVDVTISENNANYHKILENAPIEFYVKIAKKDVDTGNTVNVAGATFELYDDTGAKVSFKTMTTSGIQTIDSFTTDEKGCVYTVEKLLKGNYTLVETKAPEGYVLDSTPVAFTVSEDTYTTDSGVAIVIAEKSDKAVTGQLTIIKTGEVLDEYKGGLYVNPDEKGFTYKEGSLSGAKFNAYAAEDIYTADNQKDSSGNRIKLYSKGELVTTLVTGVDGKATANNLPLGKYKVVEVEAPDGYILNSDEQTVTFVYVDDKTPVIYESLTFSDDRQKVELSVSKLDSETGEPVSGAVFGLFTKEDIVNADGKVIVSKDTLLEKAVSDSKGLIRFVKDYPLGPYYAKEINAPAGYISSDEIIDFDAAYQGQDIKSVELTAVFLNMPSTYKFTKTDITSGAELTGATLTVLDKDGNIVDTWTSDAKEAHVIKRLVVGETYTLREEYAPYGYLKATDIQFTVKDTGEVQHVNMKDEVARGSIVVTKDGKIVSDATIRKEYWNNFVFNFLKRNLSGVTFDVYAKEDILSVDGLNTVYYKAGDKISTIVTDEQGIARIDNLPCGKYYLIETKTIDGFILDNTPIEADLSYIDQDTNIVYAGMNVTNERQKVQISVIKTDSETKKVLEGAVFGLFTKEDIVNADGKVIVNADTQIEKAVTGKDGKVTFTSDLPLGQYYVKELEAPAGYVKSDKVIDVDATYKGDNVKVIELEAAFENTPIKVEFSKTDITGEKELPGAKLSVIDSEGKIVESWISEAGKSHVIERLPVGKYTLREESAPYGYKVAVDVAFEITETSEIQKVIMKDEQAVGRIIINKSDSVTGSPIEGVVFEIRDKDGKVLDTLTTDKNGYAESKLLPICTYNKDGSYKEDIHYTVIETKAANGYILDETSYDVVLKYSDNAPVCIEETVKLTNTPKPDIPKTGDTGNVYRYALLALISLAVMVSLVMAKKSRNQKN